MMRDAGIKMLGFSIQFNNPELECLPESVVAEVIYASQEQGFKTQVKTIITPNNYRSVEEICTRAVNYGIDSQKFLRFVESGRAKGQKQYLITSEQKLDFFNQVVEARKKFPKTVLDIIMYGGFGPRPGSKGEPLALANKYCPGGIDFFAISPDNKVYNCPFAMTKPIGEFIDGKIRVERILLPDKRTDCVADLIN
jgi:MoaA/NifB/PqqE/SkfB family radical SAM enzyme